MPKGVYKHKKHSKETIKKLIQIASKRKGVARSEEVRKKIKETKRLKPYVHTKETREKMSKSHKGKPRPWRKGVPIPKNRGKGNPNWKGGISKDRSRYAIRKGSKNYENKLYLNRRRHALKLGAEGFHTLGEWETLKAQYNWTCPACGKSEPKITLTEDHIIPLSKGGSNNIENIQPLCRSCNSKKYDKIIEKYKFCGRQKT